MTNDITAYTRIKYAIERAKACGYDVGVFSTHFTLNSGDRSPEFHFYTPEEIHCYLNGVQDGQFISHLQQRTKKVKRNKKK
jgi:hypothetical protein